MIRKPHLTSREFQVLQGILNGMCSKEIAVELDVEVRTVKMHKEHIFMKFDISDNWYKSVRLVWILSGGAV